MNVKRDFIISASVRYLAYTAIVAMALSMGLEIPLTLSDKKQTGADKIHAQYQDKAEGSFTTFLEITRFAEDNPWKTRWEDTVHFLHEMLESLISFYYGQTALEEFFGKQPPVQPNVGFGE